MSAPASPSQPAASDFLPSDAVSVRYYESMRGRWSGRYRFVVTDPTALEVHVRAPLDRLRLQLLARLGGGTMRTGVSWAGNGTVRHTTAVSAWGLPGLLSVELFQLHADGFGFSVDMSQRLAPSWWHRRNFGGGSGRVRSGGQGAYYRLPWLGGTIEQKVRRIGPDEVELSQRAAWFEAMARLRRRH